MALNGFMQRAVAALVTSGCKWHINTGAAGELAAIKQSSLDYSVGKLVAWYHDGCALCHRLIKLPSLPDDAWYLSTETFTRVWIVDGSQKHLKKAAFN